MTVGRTFFFLKQRTLYYSSFFWPLFCSYVYHWQDGLGWQFFCSIFFQMLEACLPNSAAVVNFINSIASYLLHYLEHEYWNLRLSVVFDLSLVVLVMAKAIWTMLNMYDWQIYDDTDWQNRTKCNIFCWFCFPTKTAPKIGTAWAPAVHQWANSGRYVSSDILGPSVQWQMQ